MLRINCVHILSHIQWCPLCNFSPWWTYSYKIERHYLYLVFNPSIGTYMDHILSQDASIVTTLQGKTFAWWEHQCNKNIQ